MGDSDNSALFLIPIIIIVVLAIMYWYITLPLAVIGLAIYFMVKQQKEEERRHAEETARRAEEAARLERHKAEEAARLEHHKAEASRKAKENEMKTPEELFEEFEGKTAIQKEEHLKKLIGIKVQVLGEIRDVHTGYISFQNFTPALSRGNLIHISHKGDQLREQLLEYSQGDDVELTTRLTSASFDCAVYFLDLLSIRKLNR